MTSRAHAGHGQSLWDGEHDPRLTSPAQFPSVTPEKSRVVTFKWSTLTQPQGVATDMPGNSLKGLLVVLICIAPLLLIFIARSLGITFIGKIHSRAL